MNWRELQKDETDLLREAACFERTFPAFYRDASSTWTTTEDEILEFYQRCDRLFGLFDDKLVGLVYTEPIGPHTTVAHLDAKRGTNSNQLVTCIREICDFRFAEGLQLGMAWVLKRNYSLQRMLRVVGFHPSGLEMKAGSSHGQVLRWIQMVVTPACTTGR